MSSKFNAFLLNALHAAAPSQWLSLFFPPVAAAAAVVIAVRSVVYTMLDR